MTMANKWAKRRRGRACACEWNGMAFCLSSPQLEACRLPPRPEKVFVEV